MYRGGQYYEQVITYTSSFTVSPLYCPLCPPMYAFLSRSMDSLKVTFFSKIVS